MNIIGSVPVAKRDFDNIWYWEGPVQYFNISGISSKNTMYIFMHPVNEFVTLGCRELVHIENIS